MAAAAAARQSSSGALAKPALPRRPGSCAAHGLRRAGLSPRAVHRVRRGFCVRGCRPLRRVPSLPARRFRGRDSRGAQRIRGGARQRRRRPPARGLAPAGLAASPSRRVFASRDGLLYRLSPRGDRLCVPGALQTQVLHELHATPLGGHFGRDKTLALARRLVWWPGLPAAVEEYVRTCPTCQRVKADHLPPASLLYPLSVPTRRGGCISLDFLELPVARSGHNFFAGAHRPPGRARVAGPDLQRPPPPRRRRNLVGSVFRDVGLPDVLVSDRDTRFTSALWTGLHAALGASLVYGSPHHPKTTSKVERVNGVIAGVLRSFAGERADDWPALVPLVEFAINDSASPLGSATNRSSPTAASNSAVRLPPPRPLTLRVQARTSHSHGARDRGGAGVAAGPAQGGARRLTAGSAVRRVGRGAAGHGAHAPPLPLAAFPALDGPLPCPCAHGAHHVTPRHTRHVARLPLVQRRAPAALPPPSRPPRRRRGCGPAAAGSWRRRRARARGGGLLKFKMRYGRPYVLARWTGLNAAGDTWEPLHNLTNCEAAKAAFEQATGRSLPRPTPPPQPLARAAGAPPPIPPIPPAGFTVEAAPPGDLGAALVGSTALYRLASPVPLRLPLGASLAGPGGGWGPSAPGPPTPRLSLVGGSSQLPRLATGRAAVTNGHSHRMLC